MKIATTALCAFVFLTGLYAETTCGHSAIMARPRKIRLSPPISPSGAALFCYKNSSELTDESIYLQVVGVNPETGAQCFISYDSMGNPSYIDVIGKIDSQAFSYPLSFFTQNSQAGGKSLYLPKLEGARLYTSIQSKMVFELLENDQGVWTICAPNLLNPSDPNIDILWDKTEFAVDDNTVFINPTAVDNFSLPIRVEEIGLDGSSQQGGLSSSREIVFQALQKAFSEAQGIWPSLISTKPSVIFSPIFASSCGVIDENFFTSSGWLKSFVDTFSKNPLIIDASESFPISEGGGLWQGMIDPVTLVITFKRTVDDAHPAVDPVSIVLPSKASELLAGSGPSWQISTPLQAVLARDLSCAIETNTLSLTEPLCINYFLKKQPSFYQTNPSLTESLQFIDLYSKVLHSFGDHKVYSFPYDDELSQSGAASYPKDQFFQGLIELGQVGL